jgi:hypothetical protein
VLLREAMTERFALVTIATGFAGPAAVASLLGTGFTVFAHDQLFATSDEWVNFAKGRSKFVERIWKSVKYEEVYLKAYVNVPEARASIGTYLDFYNGRRPHQSLGRLTPDQAYFNALQPIPVAA